MLDNLCIHQKFIAILLLPLVPLAGGRIRSNLTDGVGAERVNTMAIWRR